MNKKTVFNIQPARNRFTGNLIDDTPIVGFYDLTETDEVVLKSIQAPIPKDDPSYSENNTYYELDPNEFDFDEIEDVIASRLGHFITNKAASYFDRITEHYFTKD